MRSSALIISHIMQGFFVTRFRIKAMENQILRTDYCIVSDHRVYATDSYIIPPDHRIAPHALPRQSRLSFRRTPLYQKQQDEH